MSYSFSNSYTDLQDPIINGWQSIDTAFLDLRIPYIQNFADVDSESSVLDIGCGTGLLLHSLIAKTKVGVDQSQHAINIAKNYRNSATYVCADFCEYIDNQKFDVVVACGLLSVLDSSKWEIVIKKALALSNRTVCFFDIPKNSVEPSYFSQYCSNYSYKYWDIPFCRFNHERFNVRLNVG